MQLTSFINCCRWTVMLVPIWTHQTLQSYLKGRSRLQGVSFLIYFNMSLSHQKIVGWLHVMYRYFLVLAQPLPPSSTTSNSLPRLLLLFHGFRLPSMASTCLPLASDVFRRFPALFVLYTFVIHCYHCLPLSPLSYCRYLPLFVLTIYSPLYSVVFSSHNIKFYQVIYQLGLGPNHVLPEIGHRQPMGAQHLC